jgi:hypothetical protein
VTLTPKELQEMAESMVSSEHGEVIHKVIDVIFTLRGMNTEVIDRMLAIHDVALQHMPDEMKPAFIGMITDLKLVKFFIEQAKAYDKTAEGEKAFESIFGNIKTNGPKTS